MLQTKVGTFLNAASSAWMLSGICCAAITSIEMAKAKAASMNVSSRVICIPRKRNPSSRGRESSSIGNADAISSCRSFTLVPSCHMFAYNGNHVRYSIHSPRTGRASLSTTSSRCAATALIIYHHASILHALGLIQ